MNCLALMISHERTSVGYLLLKKLQLFENSNDVYIILIPMFATCK